MKALFKIGYRNLLHHLKWSIPTALSIFIAVGLMSGLGTMVSSYVLSTRESIKAYEGTSHVVSYNLSRNQIAQLREDETIKEVDVVNIVSYAKISDYELLSTQNPYLKLVHANPQNLNYNGVYLSSGRLPENESEIVLNEMTLNYTNLFFELGETIVLDIGHRESEGREVIDRHLVQGEQFISETKKTYTIVGFVNVIPLIGSYEEAGFVSLVYQPESSLHMNVVLMELTNPNPMTFNHIKGVLSSFDAELTKTNNLGTYFIGLESIVQSPLYFLYFASILIVLLILIASTLVIYNAFSINNRHMVTQLGTLDAIGATHKQKRTVLLFQAMILATVSIPLGLLLGYMSTSVLLFYFQRPLSEMIFFSQMHVTLFPSILLSILLISVLTIVVTAFLLSRKVSDMSSIESMKYYDRQMEKEIDLKIPKRYQSIEKRLAYINFKKNVLFYRSLISSLIVSIILIATAVSIGSAQHKMSIESKQDVIFEYQKDEIDDGQLISIVSELKENPLFDQSGLWQQYHLMLTYHKPLNQDYVDAYGEQFLYLIVNVVDDEYCYEKLESQFNGLDCDQQGLLLDYFEVDYITMDNETKHVSGHLFEEDQELDFSLNEQTFKMALGDESIFYSRLENESDPALYFSQSYFDYLSSPLAIYLKENSGNSIGQINTIFVNSDRYIEAQNELTAVLSRHSVDNLARVENFRELTVLENQLFQFYGIISLALVLLVIVIALSNVMNSINHSLALRGKEISILISNGMTYDSYIKMILTEVGLIGLKSFMIGLPISVALSAFIRWALNLTIENWVTHWVLIGFICVGLIVMIMVLSVLLSLFSIKNHNLTQLTKE